MQPVCQVLAPIDLLTDPDGPVEHAISISSALGAELTLLYVSRQRWFREAGRGGWPHNAFNESRTNSAIHRVVLPGDPAETISRYAEFINADLLVMTTEHHRRWARYWRSSVTEDVLGRTLRRVCITDPGSADLHNPFSGPRILCVLSLDGTDDSLIGQAEALAQRSRGELILLGVVPGIDEGLFLETVPGYDRPLSAQLAVERLQALGKGIAVPYKRSIMTGSEYNCIRVAAEEQGADLVIAARPSRGQTEAKFLRVRAILRGLRCPLLSVTNSLPSSRSVINQPEMTHRLTGQR
jgi:nucleotide-binding universal stress UspA family protein